MDTVADTLRLAARTLAASSDSPQLDAEVLLSTVMGVVRSALIVRAEEPVDVELLRAYRRLIDRRMSGVPVAYLTGRREFWSLPLKVTPAVLVPRPETELLVEQALEILPPGGQAPAILDLGTGSGAIALALAVERPRARIVGVDISAAALKVAGENAGSLGLTSVEWKLGTWFEAVPNRQFDLIVSNPPYVATGDPALAALRAEPAAALIGGPTGLEQLTSIVAAAPGYLVPGGWLLVEHGADQAGRVAALFGDHRFEDIHSHEDYSGRPRLTRGRHRGPPGGPSAFNREPS